MTNMLSPSKNVLKQAVLPDNMMTMNNLQRFSKCLAKLPNRQLLQLGKYFGLLSYYISPYRRHIADINCRICFPELMAKQRKALIKKHFISSGQGAFEAIIAWWKPSDKLPPFEVQGLSHVENALAKGKGVILLSAHFTSLELIGRLLSEKIDYAIIYRKQKNQSVNTMMEEARNGIYHRAIDRQDGRGIFRALKDNMALWLAADQDYGRKHSTFALFFGLPAAFITSPTRLAGKTGAAVLPMMYHRLPDGRGYRVDFGPELERFNEEDAETNAATTSHLIEDAIRQHPEQYLWLHRRFKTRPEGKARYYQ